MRADGEGEVNVHARRVALHRLSRNFSTSAKATISSNFRRTSARVMPGIAPFRLDIFATGEFRVEPPAHLEQACDPSAENHPARGRFGDAAEDLEKHALAGSIAPDGSQYLAAFNLEADIL